MESFPLRGAIVSGFVARTLQSCRCWNRAWGPPREQDEFNNQSVFCIWTIKVPESGPCQRPIRARGVGFQGSQAAQGLWPVPRGGVCVCMCVTISWGLLGHLGPQPSPQQVAFSSGLSKQTNRGPLACLFLQTALFPWHPASACSPAAPELLKIRLEMGGKGLLQECFFCSPLPPHPIWQPRTLILVGLLILLPSCR